MYEQATQKGVPRQKMEDKQVVSVTFMTYMFDL